MQQPPQNNMNTIPNNPNQKEEEVNFIQRIQSPNGIGFDDESKLRKLQKLKYKEDLDYLVNLRNQNKIPVNNENELKREYHKIQQMNDVSFNIIYFFFNLMQRYNYEKLTQQAVIREFNAWNEREAYLRKQQKNDEVKKNFNYFFQRKQSYEEYLNGMNNYQQEILKEKKIEKEKRENLRQLQQEDLLNYYRRKDEERSLRDKELEKNLKTMKERENKLFDSYNQYKDKIYKLNNHIYENALRYNDYMNGGKNDELFKVNNDLEYNKRIAELKDREKRLNIINSNQQILRKYEEDNEKQKEIDRLMKEQRLNEQKNYRNILDKQSEERRNELKRIRSDYYNMGKEQLMMPGYKHPNLPKPLEQYVLSNSLSTNFIGNNINYTNYFNSQRRIDYLGDSNLKHNPITCPIDDLEYNKYVIDGLKRVYDYTEEKRYRDMKLNRSFSYSNNYSDYGGNYNLNNNRLASGGNMVINN